MARSPRQPERGNKSEEGAVPDIISDEMTPMERFRALTKRLTRVSPADLHQEGECKNDRAPPG